MTTFRFYIFLSLITIVVIGCNNEQNENEELKLVSEFYANGDLSFTYHISEDSIWNGLATSYYPNEKIKFKYNYLQGYRHGDVEFYDSLTSRLTVKLYYWLDTLKYYEFYNSSGEITSNFRYLLEEEVPEFDSSFVKVDTSQPFLISGETVSMSFDFPGIPAGQITPSIWNGTMW